MNTTSTKPNYFSVIPAAALLDTTLTDKAKILYSEISALCNKNSYCWATNNYFEELYECSRITVIRAIKSLKERDYIKVIFKNGQRTINLSKPNEKGHIYSVIPAAVRYDNRLTDKAKILYGTITALCTKKGYCWATNNYFAEQYKCTTKQIIRLIKTLETNNHITVERASNRRKIKINNYDKWIKLSALCDKNNNGFDKEVEIYDITEDIIVLYFDIYEKYKGEQHPTLTGTNKRKVKTKLSAFIDEHLFNDDFDSDIELWEDMIVMFFENLTETDGNINQFSERNILKYRYYETGGKCLDY